GAPPPSSTRRSWASPPRCWRRQARRPPPCRRTSARRTATATAPARWWTERWRAGATKGGSACCATCGAAPTTATARACASEAPACAP
ncbi:unnamed protein product, partial [Prorocentrum cordatum]